MQHIYQVPMSARMLAVHRNLLNLAANIMNKDALGISQANEIMKASMRDLGNDEFRQHHDLLDKLIEQVVANGEGLEIKLNQKPFNPFVEMLKAIGFNVLELDESDSLPTTVCCGHPDPGAETDPLCEHCGQRHP